MDVFTLHRGTRPLLVSLPHDGTAVPGHIAARMTAEARRVPDTDWHVARLYAVARDLGASMLVPAYSRYVVDLNRPPDDVSLYPGQNTTGLCPTVRFSGDPVYLPGQAPDPAAGGDAVLGHRHGPGQHLVELVLVDRGPEHRVVGVVAT